MLNPELKRNIWLDFSGHRVILTLFVISLTTYLYHWVRGDNDHGSLAFGIAYFFIIFWGNKNASEAVIDEVNNNTWDFQRQSALSPWSMAIGKWLGSTLFSWFGASVCLLLYWLLSSSPNAFKEIIILVLCGLLTQAYAILSSIQVLPQVRREKNVKTFRYFVSAILLGMILYSLCSQMSSDPNTLIYWNGYDIPGVSFTLLTLVLFLGWAALGLQRSFAKELQYQNIPWAWLGFNIYCMIYFAGFASQSNPMITLPPETNILQGALGLSNLAGILHSSSTLIAFFIAQLFAYVAVFEDTLTIQRYKKFFARVHDHNIKESLEQLPWWMLSFLLAVIAGILVIFQQPATEQQSFISIPILICSTVLFLLRDIALVHYFNFGTKKNAMSTAMIYLFILYFLIPMLLHSLSQPELVNLFIPSWQQASVVGIFSPLVQIAGIGWLCWQRRQASKANI
jgi:hypothetical protein